MVKVTPCEQKKKSYVGIFLDFNRQKHAESVDQIPVTIKI